MAHLLDLPHEVLQTVLQYVEPADLGSLACAGSELNEFIRDNNLLFKEVYLRHYDNPIRKSSDPEPKWEEELPKLVKLEKLLLSEELYVKTSNAPFIANTIIHLLANSTTDGSNPGVYQSPNLRFLRRMFENKLNYDTILCSSSLFEEAGTEMHIPANLESERQLSAKLHCYYGVPASKRSYDDLLKRTGSPVTGEFVRTDPYARSRVYDLRRYTQNTMWGPFADDGSQRVDWEKVEAVMIDLAFNMDLFSERTENTFPPVWARPWSGAAAHSFVPPRSTSLPKEVVPALDAEDPYGVSGTWMRVVCFLDYSEFVSFNFGSEPPPLGAWRDPIGTEEATRIISMKLRVTKVEPPGPGDGQALPVVTFRGTSRSMHRQWDPNANSDIRGSVRLTPEGEVRWTTYSIYYGEERWKSEGIQVGGLRSARGVLGNWFDKDYDHDGPAGPTAFWKLMDEIVDDKDERRAELTLIHM